MLLSRALRLFLVCLALVTAMPATTLAVRDEISASIAAFEHGSSTAAQPRSRVGSPRGLGSAMGVPEPELTVAAPPRSDLRAPTVPAFLLNCSWLC